MGTLTDNFANLPVEFNIINGVLIFDASVIAGHVQASVTFSETIGIRMQIINQDRRSRGNDWRRKKTLGQ